MEVWSNDAETKVNRKQKQGLVSNLHDLFEGQTFVAVTHYKGLTVNDMDDLRGRMREAGASFRVTKNRLTRLALAGTKFEGLRELFTGPTAIAYSEDPVAAARVCANFAKKNEKLIILGGVLDGENMDASSVKELAKLPSLDELRGKIVAMISTPATRIAAVVRAPAGQLVQLLHAKSQKEEAA